MNSREPATTNVSKPSRFRFRLGTLLSVVTLCGVLAAWWADRARLNGQILDLNAQNRVLSDQTEELQQRLSLQYGAVQIVYWWASADEFIEMLTTTQDEETFLEMAPSIASSEDPTFGQAVKQLTKLLSAEEERTRARSLVALRFMRVASADRIAEHETNIIPAVISRLEDESSTVIGEAIGTLQSFGPAAKQAVPVIRQRMSDDDEWYAPSFAVTLVEIDPSIDVGPRLVELIERKHPNWYQAAFALPRFVDSETARGVLTKCYEEAKDEGERDAMIQCLNQIQTVAKD